MTVDLNLDQPLDLDLDLTITEIRSAREAGDWTAVLKLAAWQAAELALLEDQGVELFAGQAELLSYLGELLDEDGYLQSSGRQLWQAAEGLAVLTSANPELGLASASWLREALAGDQVLVSAGPLYLVRLDEDEDYEFAGFADRILSEDQYCHAIVTSEELAYLREEGLTYEGEHYAPREVSSVERQQDQDTRLVVLPGEEEGTLEVFAWA